jgi:hypothetical protein
MEMVYQDSITQSTLTERFENDPSSPDEQDSAESPNEEFKSTDDMNVESSAPSLSNPSVMPTAPALIPSMRGMMTYAGGSITCKGKWAMTDANHSLPGHTSDFEFKLVKKDELCLSIFPVDGKYQGWFMLKQAPPLKGSAKIEDKDLHLRFETMDDGNFKIIGQGENKFGLFHLNGTLSETGTVHIYREYYKFNPMQVPVVGSSSSKKGRIERRPSISTVDVETPREASQRVRRQSSQMKDFQEMQRSPRSYDGLAGMDESISSSLGFAVQRQPSLGYNNNQERAQRLPPAFRRCLELLKEFMKLPQSRWFLEPVDAVKLNIPDYPKIIKTPMDFGTIRANLENSVYETLDQFAEDMRLVFRNAVQFNTMKENIVHIAARELSGKFEDRFRALLASVNTVNYSLSAEPKMFRSSSNGFGGGGGAKKKKFPGGTPRLSGPGPRTSFPFIPPAAMDGSMTQMIELQRQMAAMQEELNRLRSLVTEKEIANSLRESKEAAQNPLTFEEKKQLVAMVAKLPHDSMHQLVQIIRDGLPDDKKNDEINEVPLDILDTLTLRKLQRFVQNNVIPEKKKRAAPSSGERPPRSDGGVKRVKKENGAIADLGTTEFGPSGDHGEIDLFDHDELFLDTEKFEEGDDSGDAMQTEKFDDFPGHASKEVNSEEAVGSYPVKMEDEEDDNADGAVTDGDQSHGKEITQDMLNQNLASVDHDDADDGWAALEGADT